MVVHEFKVFSIRRSGMSQMTATKIYNAQPSQGFTKARGMAREYMNRDILPLASRPMAVARVDL